MPQSNPILPATPSPFSPQKFFEPLPPPSGGAVIPDDSDSWWAGAQRFFSSLSFAAALVTTTILTFPSQGVASALCTDEDFWNNQVAPVWQSFNPVYLPDAEYIPAGFLHGQPDEDFPGPLPAPVNVSFIWPQPFVFEQNEQAFGLHGQPDEDFWNNPVFPVPLSFQWPNPWQFEQHEQAFGLHGQPDEDFYQPVAPWIFTNIIPVQNDELIVPQPGGVLSPDEDFWVNPTSPVPATLLWPSPWIFDLQDPAGNLYGQPDEDFWQNPVFPVGQFFAGLYLPDAEYLPAGSLYGQPDEDFWQNPVFPVWQSFVPVYLPDSEELPAGSLYGQPDEDFWINSVPPVQTTFGPIYLPDVEELPAGSLYHPLDEDYWTTSVQLQQWSASLFSDDEIIVPQVVTVLPPDEDFWNNLVPPVQSTFLSISNPLDIDDFPPTPPVFTNFNLLKLMGCGT
jgi:hypothetical protein